MKILQLIKAIILDIITIGGLLTFRYYSYTIKLLKEWKYEKIGEWEV